MKINVCQVEGKGLHMKVTNKDGTLFMASPLNINLPKKPVSMNPIVELRWDSKCRAKIEKSIRQTFTKELYGDIDIKIDLGLTDDEVFDNIPD